MKIAVASDLHTEWHDLEITSCDAEIVFLVGDIGTGVRGVEWAIEQFNKFTNVKLVIFVPGNHDFYGCDNVYAHIAAMRQAAEGTKVRVLYNEFIDCDGYRFLGSTLWTDFKLHGNQTLGMINAMTLKPEEVDENGDKIPGPRVHQIADFDKIGWEYGEPITAENMLRENEKAVDFIFSNLSDDLVNVVLTHFPPAAMVSFRSQWYKVGDPAAPYFTNTLDNNIGYSNIKFWFYGHNHDSAMYELGDTQLLGWMRGHDRPGPFELHEMEI